MMLMMSCRFQTLQFVSAAAPSKAEVISKLSASKKGENFVKNLFHRQLLYGGCFRQVAKFISLC
jgi:hypothetical protein